MDETWLFSHMERLKKNLERRGYRLQRDALLYREIEKRCKPTTIKMTKIEQLDMFKAG